MKDVHLYIYTWLMRQQRLQAQRITVECHGSVLLLLLVLYVLTLCAQVSAAESERQCSDKHRIHPRDALLPQSPSLADGTDDPIDWDGIPHNLRLNNYLHRSPPATVRKAVALALGELAVPGAVLAGNSFLLGFLSQQLAYTIPHEGLRGLSYPLTGAIWHEIIAPSRSLKEAVWNTIPSVIDGLLTLVSKTPHWAGGWTYTLRSLLTIYTMGLSLAPALSQEREMYSGMDRRKIIVEGFSGVNIVLERNRPDDEPAKNRFTLSWLPSSESRPDGNGMDENHHHPVGQALQSVIDRAAQLRASALQLYPSDNDGDENGRPAISLLWKIDDDWTSPTRVEFPPIKSRWWTTLVCDHYFEHNNKAELLADPLSADVLNFVSEAAVNCTQETVTSASIMTGHQHSPQLATLSGEGHANIWLTPSASALLSNNSNRIPNITLQLDQTFESDLEPLQKYINKSLLPGWSQLPWQLVKTTLLTKLSSWAWKWGLSYGKHLETSKAFPGAYPKRPENKIWLDNIKPPGHTEHKKVILSDGEEMTGHLVKSTTSEKNKSLLIVYHPAKDTSGGMSNSGQLTLNNEKWATELGKFLNEKGYDVFFPEYRGYKNPLHPTNQTQFFEDAVSFFDQIASDYKNISVIGYSIGTGAASHVASVRDDKIDRLVLLAPFRKLHDITKQFIGFVPPNWVMKFNMNNQDALMKTNKPVHILHGGNDRVIPSSGSLQMYNYLKEQKKDIHRYEFKGLTHNDILKDQTLMTQMINIFSESTNQ